MCQRFRLGGAFLASIRGGLGGFGVLSRRDARRNVFEYTMEGRHYASILTAPRTMRWYLPLFVLRLRARVNKGECYYTSKDLDALSLSCVHAVNWTRSISSTYQPAVTFQSHSETAHARIPITNIQLRPVVLINRSIRSYGEPGTYQAREW